MGRGAMMEKAGCSEVLHHSIPQQEASFCGTFDSFTLQCRVEKKNPRNMKAFINKCITEKTGSDELPSLLSSRVSLCCISIFVGDPCGLLSVSANDYQVTLSFLQNIQGFMKLVREASKHGRNNSPS